MKWAYYNPATGIETASAHFNALNNGTATYRYYARTYVDQNGAVFWAVNVALIRNSDSFLIAENHFLLSYTSSGVQVWASASFPNPVLAISGPGLGAFQFAASAGLRLGAAGSLQGTGRPCDAVPGILRHRPSGHVGQGQGGRQDGLSRHGRGEAEADLC